MEHTKQHNTKNEYVKPFRQVYCVQSLALGKQELLDSTSHLQFCIGILFEGRSQSGPDGCELDVLQYNCIEQT